MGQQRCRGVALQVGRGAILAGRDDQDEHRVERILRGLGAIAQLGERLLCKQEVAGSIPAGSILRIPVFKRDSIQQPTRRRLLQVPDGSVLEAFRSALTDRSRSGCLACRRRAAAAPLAGGNGGGAAGLISPNAEAAARHEPKPYALPPPKSIRPG